MRETPRSMTVIALLAAVALGSTACNTEPTCEKAAARVLELIEKQNQEMLAKFPEGQRKQLAEMAAKSLPAERLVEQCKKSFTKEQIACTVAAKTLEDASRCNQAAAPAGDTKGTPAPGATPPPLTDDNAALPADDVAAPPAGDNPAPPAGEPGEPAPAQPE